MSLLEVNNLSTSFFTRDGEVEAVGDVSFSVDEGQVLGVVGESGCGKSVTALSMLGLLPKPGVVKQGEVLFKGRNLVEMRPDDLKDLRGKEVSMIFQQPGSALNPVYKVGAQIAEVFKLHTDLDKKERNAEAIDAYNHAIGLDPDFADPHFNLATLYEKVGDARAALRHFRIYRKLTRS